uniref:Bm1583 n=1 Tax=Brugia malayi TaxID=6279 RepID=A0A1I9G6V4_BRUMA|nr:Bm1583 [Brugia malayi]
MDIKISIIGALALGSIFIIVGVLSLTIVPLTVNKEVIKNEHLGYNENGTYNVMTQRWIEQKYSMKLKIWTVSVANPNDISKGSYPVLIEKGPYAYTLVICVQFIYLFIFLMFNIIFSFLLLIISIS